MMASVGSCVASINPNLGSGSSLFAELIPFTPLFMSLLFALDETATALEPARSNGCSWMSPARNDSSLWLTNPFRKEENAPGSPAGASVTGIPTEPALGAGGDHRETCKPLATFTPLLTQLEHHPAGDALHTLTLVNPIQNWHKSRCDTFLSRPTCPTTPSSADLA